CCYYRSLIISVWNESTTIDGAKLVREHYDGFIDPLIISV
ncbi:hypothetical protein ACHAXM_000568, partial [Skeletonema potamos]